MTTATLAEMQLFSGMSETALNRLANLAALKHYAASEVLFHEAEQFRELLVVRKGKVQLQMRVPGHGNIPILTLGPGQLVAWSAILGTGEMTTSAVSLEETELFAIPGDKLKEICEQDHEFGFRFMQRFAGALARRLVATRLQLLDLFSSERPEIPDEEEYRG